MSNVLPPTFCNSTTQSVKIPRTYQTPLISVPFWLTSRAPHRKLTVTWSCSHTGQWLPTSWDPRGGSGTLDRTLDHQVPNPLIRCPLHVCICLLMCPVRRVSGVAMPAGRRAENDGRKNNGKHNRKGKLPFCCIRIGIAAGRSLFLFCDVCVPAV